MCVLVLVCVTELKGEVKETSQWAGRPSWAGDCPAQEPEAWARAGLSVPLIP